MLLKRRLVNCRGWWGFTPEPSRTCSKGSCQWLQTASLSASTFQAPPAVCGHVAHMVQSGPVAQPSVQAPLKGSYFLGHSVSRLSNTKRAICCLQNPEPPGLTPGLAPRACLAWEGPGVQCICHLPHGILGYQGPWVLEYTLLGGPRGCGVHLPPSVTRLTSKSPAGATCSQAA